MVQAITKKKAQPSNASWDRFLQIAKYEINFPYRGIENATTAGDSPWNICREVSAEHEDDVVARVCHSSCPSVRAWTVDTIRQREQRRRKNRKTTMQIRNALGRRPEGCSSYCDSNPFCLVSIGGAMDDFLGEAAKRVLPLLDSTNKCAAQSTPSNHSKGNNYGFFSNDEIPSEQEGIKNCEIVEVIDTDNERPEILRKSKRQADVEDTGKNPSPKIEVALPLDNLSNVYTMELPIDDEVLDPDSELSIYSRETQAQLNDLRRVESVDIGPIISYFESVIKSKSDMTAAEYIHRVRRWNNTMVFSNPLRQIELHADDKLALAIPPGMINLGATCYLNTQLQCLARNTIFLEGIFSWRPNSSLKNPMENVLEKLQLLLARMVHGAQRSISTDELSEALGLKNDEMQDPNEFARLLFERMHESFQKCASGNKDQEALGNLLPSLFQGSMAYKTICLKCRHSKQRKEDFMDLNLPIAHRAAEMPTNSGQQKLEEALDAMKDTDMQYCLDRYLYPEDLTVDNQYFCDQCKSKQNATRQVVFCALPPVLNLQLCRYIFDKEKFVKKKLTDGVMLSQTLQVPSKDKMNPTKYVLCAVMQHRGNSAYHGHYVAEAMDWQTGKWFEFNDELVKILEDGPNCSVISFDGAGGKKKGRFAKGSQDAYNMYYVRESFLAKSAASSIASEEGLESEQSDGRRKDTVFTSVLRQMSMERSILYSMLSDMCVSDERVADRLRRRKIGLRSLLSGCFTSSNTDEISFALGNGQKGSDVVWTDGNAFRMFLGLQCGEEGLSNKVSIQMCEHNVGIHPRLARTGKLLPLATFNGYVTLLRGEMAYSRSFTDGKREPSIGQDTVLFAEDVICTTCCLIYKAELKEKLDLLKKLKELNDELEPKGENDVDCDFGHEYVYAISRKFITRFRNRVNEVLCLLEYPGAELGGIDSLNLSDFLPARVSTKRTYSDGDKGIDNTVNSSILCKHGRCCNTVNKRAVRFVSARTWSALREVFTDAFELKKHRGKMHEIVPCENCSTSSLEKDKLYEWASKLTTGLPQSLLEGRKRNDAEFLSGIKNSEGEILGNGFILVHKDDMKRWRDSLSLATFHGNVDVKLLKDRLQKLLFPSAGDYERDGPNDVLTCFPQQWQPVRLICSEHKKCFFDALFENSSEGETGVYRLSSRIEALSQEEYFGVVKSVYSIYTAIFCNADQTNSKVDVDSLERLFLHLNECFHPSISFTLTGGVQADEAVLVKCGTGGKCSSMKLCPAKCGANCESVENPAKANGKMIEPRLSVSEREEIEVLDVLPAKMNENSEILLRVFTVKAATDFDVAISAIGEPNNGSKNDDSSLCFFPRRSGRKRKQRYSLGAVETEDAISVRPTHNFAALRLMMYEKFPCFRVDHQLVLVLPTLKEAILEEALHESHCEGQFENTLTGTKPLSLVIPYDWNAKSLSEAVNIAIEGRKLSEPERMATMAELILMRASGEDHDGASRLKITLSKLQALNDAHLESLLEVANFSDCVDGASVSLNGKSKSVRKPERGFRGTLLGLTNHNKADDPTIIQDANQDESIQEGENDDDAIIVQVANQGESMQERENANLGTIDNYKTPSQAGEMSSDNMKPSTNREYNENVFDMEQFGDVKERTASGQKLHAMDESAGNDDDHSHRQKLSVRLNKEEIMEVVLTALLDCGMDIDIDTMNGAITWAQREYPKENLRQVADAAIAKCMQQH